MSNVSHQITTLVMLIFMEVIVIIIIIIIDAKIKVALSR